MPRQDAAREGEVPVCARPLARSGSRSLSFGPMTATAHHTTPRASRLAGYLLALAAGATWGTTGPLSTGLYALMPATSIGFWRVLLGTAAVALAVAGGSNAGAEAERLELGACIAGGLISAVSYALTTLMARFVVPRYGAVRVLFLEAIGGMVILVIVLTLAGRAPTP